MADGSGELKTTTYLAANYFSLVRIHVPLIHKLTYSGLQLKIKKKQNSFIIGGNTKIPTCAVNQVGTTQVAVNQE